MLPYSWIILALSLASGDAALWSPSTAAFVAHPMPTSSSWQYANYLANCSRLFHSLVDNCGNGSTSCPILTDRTPASPISDMDNLFADNATTFDKLLAFYYYNIDTEIQNAKGVTFANTDLHLSDFTNSTNHAWQCKRLNYRHLLYYELATTEELSERWVRLDSYLQAPLGSWVMIYVYPETEWPIGVPPTTSARLTFYEDFYQLYNYTPAFIIKMIGTDMKASIASLVSPQVNFDVVQFSKFYLQYDFEKIVEMATNAQALFTGNTFLDELNDSWKNKIIPDTTIPNTWKAQIKQFINAMTQRWTLTSDPTTRYYYFSELYFEMFALMRNEQMLGLIYLSNGQQLGDIFYLNYFFGLPS